MVTRGRNETSVRVSLTEPQDLQGYPESTIGPYAPPGVCLNNGPVLYSPVVLHLNRLMEVGQRRSGWDRNNSERTQREPSKGFPNIVIKNGVWDGNSSDVRNCTRVSFGVHQTGTNGKGSFKIQGRGSHRGSRREGGLGG